MEKYFFLKKTNIDVIPYYIMIYLMMALILGLMIWRIPTVLYEILVIFLILSMFLFLLIKYTKNNGLYIKNKTIYYKSLKKIYINLEDIEGVKIIKSFSAGGKYRGFYPLKNSKGCQLYSAIFVSSVNREMINYQKGDLWFYQRFKKQIICSTIYNKEAIDYLQSINNNIKLI